MTVMAVPVVGPIDLSRPEIEEFPDGPVEWRLISSDDDIPAGEIVDALVHRAKVAVDALTTIDLGLLDRDATEALVVGVEKVARAADGAGVRVTEHIDATEPFRSDGVLNTRAFLKHRLQLSGPDAHGRLQMARASRELATWAAAHSVGQIGTSQFRLMARIAANARIDVTTLHAGADELLFDAMECSYREFERRALTWEALADPVGALNKSERARQIRDVVLTPVPSGGWTLSGRLDGLSGAEVNEVWAYFVDAEWRSDWHDAKERCASEGREPTINDMERTQAQRRADAFSAMARAAAANVSSTGAILPTVNLLIDEDTARSTVTGEPIDPARYRSVVSRTAAGVPIHPRDVMGAALWGRIRRVVRDAAGVVIDMGRRSRLFTGTAREAVMLLEAECVWTGCDRPTSACHADHLNGWKGGGRTRPSNGGPLCPCHNVLKESGFTVHRDANGEWHTFGPGGREII